MVGIAGCLSGSIGILVIFDVLVTITSLSARDYGEVMSDGYLMTTMSTVVKLLSCCLGGPLHMYTSCIVI
jgi:hypothetical protein